MLRSWCQLLPVFFIKWYARKWIARHDIPNSSYFWCRAFDDVWVRAEDTREIGKTTKRIWWCGNGDHDHHTTKASAQMCINDRLAREAERK